MKPFFQLNQITNLSRFGIYGAGVALVCLGAYGVYHVLKKGKDASAEPEPKKDNNDESRPTETTTTTEATAGADHSGASEVERPVPDAEEEDHAALTPEVAVEPVVETAEELSPEQKFFDAVYAAAKQVVADQDWSTSTHALHLMKYRTSEPRKTVVNGQPTLIFPLGPGLNVTLVGDVLYYMADKKRQTIEFNMGDVNRRMEVTPDNQAKAYVFEKGMELLSVRSGTIHPDFAYPENFDSERGLATNYQLKKMVSMETSIAFFDKVFKAAVPTTVYPYTRSDMAYISAIVNSEPVDNMTAFANLEGDSFVHFADPIHADKNMVLVYRSATKYVQIFRGTGVSMEVGTDFQGWKKPVGEMFNISAENHMPLALFMSTEIAREVLGVVVEPAPAQSANAG